MSGGAGFREGLAVRVRGLKKRFGYREALRGIDLDVERGTCLAVRGPNGAGKSTLIGILATLRTFDAGEVAVLGDDARERAVRVRSRIGVLLHESFLRRELTLEENLRFACELRGLRFREVRDAARGLLERFGLSERAGDRVGAFSQGMARRAGILRSLLGAPDLWLLDEPQAGLDAEGSEVLVGLLREHLAAGRSAVVATHDPSLAERVGARTLWLAGGLVAAGREGGPEP